jgi:hypothetical protein
MGKIRRRHGWVFRGCFSSLPKSLLYSRRNIGVAPTKKLVTQRCSAASLGIRRLPNHKLWNSVEGKGVILKDGPRSGYCHHAKTTFPTRHRPYLALLEVSLYSRPALSLANFLMASTVQKDAGDCCQVQRTEKV